MISVAGERARQDFSIEFSQSVNHRVLCVDDDFVALHWDSGKAITFARRKSNQQKKISERWSTKMRANRTRIEMFPARAKLLPLFDQLLPKN